jgi:hypothetical protein
LRTALFSRLILVAELALLLACDRGAPGDTQARGDPPAATREAAARRGIAWLVGRKEEMGPAWTFAIFSYLHPIAPDAELAETCNALRAEASRTPFLSLDEAFRDPHPLRMPVLQPILAELLRRKWAGEPYEKASAALERRLHQHAEAFWRHVPRGQQAVVFYGFSTLGIEPKRTLDDIVRDLRAAWNADASKVLLADPGFMFGLTHVFYAASEYFTRYPDPERFEPEIEMLRTALRHYLEKPVPNESFFLDVQAEVLVALELLRVPHDADMLAMKERLLALQNADGSWGQRGGIDQYHATVVAVQALLDYPEELRPREWGLANAASAARSPRRAARARPRRRRSRERAMGSARRA